MRECDGYFISLRAAGIDGVACMTRPVTTHGTQRLFAGMATDEELVGLPPHVISVNELDPLRDEGLVYYRKLLRAGVPAVGAGWWPGHATAAICCCRALMPEVFAASIRDVSGFANSLG